MLSIRTWCCFLATSNGASLAFTINLSCRGADAGSASRRALVAALALLLKRDWLDLSLQQRQQFFLVRVSYSEHAVCAEVWNAAATELLMWAAW